MKGSNFDDKTLNLAASFRLICLFLSVKLWCKPYFKPLTSNSCENKLMAGMLQLLLLIGFCDILAPVIL